MARVNIITRTTADAIAANYFKNESVKALYVTRDGQVFYKGKEHYLKMHEKANKLEPSWPYFNGGAKEVIQEEEGKSTEVIAKDVAISFTSLKKYFQELTDKGEIKKDEWINLKFAQLRKKYEEINNKKE